MSATKKAAAAKRALLLLGKGKQHLPRAASGARAGFSAGPPPLCALRPPAGYVLFPGPSAPTPPTLLYDFAIKRDSLGSKTIISIFARWEIFKIPPTQQH
jgi:hypothetical protein